MIHYRDIMQQKFNALAGVQNQGQAFLFEHWEPEAVIKKSVASKANGFVFSVSALNSFLQCKAKFYYLYIVGLPSPKTEATEFGSAVHFALETFFKAMQVHPQKAFGSKQQLLSFFLQYMNANKQFFTDDSFNERIGRGKQALDGYYDNYIDKWNKVVSIEKFVSNIFIDTIPVKGKIDKLEFDGKDVTVVDYKTGSHAGIFSSLSAPCNDLEAGGNYWRQAVFYKLLVDNIPGSNWKVKNILYDFVEPTQEGKFLQEVVDISAADIYTVKQQLFAAKASVQQMQFFEGCNEPECKWCNLAQKDEFFISMKNI